MISLKPGDAAPLFSANDQHGNRVSLDSLRGKKVVLYFYPKDDTPGCTAEACNLRDNHSALINLGYVVIGVSPDATAAHTKFTQKYELPFSLIPDTSREIILAYGAWGPKKFMGKSYDGVLRSTFVIGVDGLIEKVFTQVDTKNHTEQILKD
jgi:thioredoxin-dependent peroxiredoxin